MSWRGVKKSISRLPHQFKTRNGGEDVTRDLEYLELEKRYKEVVKSADELRVEAMNYRDNLATMFGHQVQAANNLAELCGLSMEEPQGPMTRYPSYESENIPPEIKQALEDYATAMAYSREETLAILDDLDAFVVRPADRFQMITRVIDKTIVKRDHKLIDYDRHRIAYLKYSAISEPTPSEEKNMFKLQSQYDNAAADYDYFNNMLKDELVRFLDLAQAFIEPVMEQLFNIQCRIMGGLYGRLHEVIQHNGAIFSTLDMPIEEGFNARLAEFNAREELDKSELFRDGVKPWQRSGVQSRYARSHQHQMGSGESYYSDEEGDYLSTQQGYSMTRTLSNRSSNSSLGGRRPSYTEYSSSERAPPAYNDRRPSISDRKTSVPEIRSSYADRRPSIADRRPSIADRRPSVSERPSIADRRPSISERASIVDRRPSVSERPPIVDRKPPALSPRPAFNTRARSLSSSNTPPPIRRPSTSVLQSALRQDSSSAPRGLPSNVNDELNRAISSAATSSFRSLVTPPSSANSSTPTTPPIIVEAYRRRNTVSAVVSPFLDQEQEVEKKKRAPPPPPSKKVSSNNVKREFVEALYELNAPQDGDLSFRVGDRIEVLEKSEKTHDWWKGKLGDKVGMFPANYVRQI